MALRMFAWFGRPSVYCQHSSPRLSYLDDRIMPDAAPHNLAVSNFYQNWNNATLITANDDWSAAPGVVGYLGDDTFGEGVNPQTVLTPYSAIDVIANQGSSTTLTDGGVAEFDGLGVIALQPDGTADAPNLVVSINTTGRANIFISYSLLDVDGTADNAVQPVALQYRIGNVGNFVNVPAGFVADATTGPSSATKVTPVNVTLPSAVDNQSLVQVRIITTNAVGNDEWVAVDNIVVGSKEFAINTYTTSSQLIGYSRAVAVDAAGDALVVWQSYGQDGNSNGIYGQRFNAAGAKVGGEFRINTYTTGAQTLPSVAMDADGDAVVVWTSYGQNGIANGIYGQRFNSGGAKVGGEFPINTYTTGYRALPSVAMDADGDSVVAWEGVGSGDGFGVFGQRFDAAGAKVGGEFEVNTYATDNQENPSVAMDADGDAMIVWRSFFQDGSGYAIEGQRFDSAGTKVGSEFQANTYTTGSQAFASVAVDADGDAVVVWESTVQDKSGYGVYGQRFDSADAKVGGEFQVNTSTTGDQRLPSVALDADGDAVVVWTTGSTIVFAQRFDSAGASVGVEFQVNTSAGGFTESVAVDADGDAMVVWKSSSDGNGSGISGQRFRSPNPAAKFSNIQINDGSSQRSLVTSLKLTFDSPVTFAGSPSAAFSLVNQMTSNAATLSAAVDPTGTAVTLTFTGGSIDFGGSLADGRYTLTINANQFTGYGFDGNGDGIPGDNYVLIGTPAVAPKLYRLFGDSDGDGDVDTTDFAALRAVFGGVSVVFDFDNDGDVDTSDFGQFRQRFGMTV